MKITTQLRKKLTEAKELYNKIDEIQEEVKAMIELELKDHDKEYEVDYDFLVEYFDYVMNGNPEMAEMLIMRDILDTKIKLMREADTFWDS